MDHTARAIGWTALGVALPPSLARWVCWAMAAFHIVVGPWGPRVKVRRPEALSNVDRVLHVVDGEWRYGLDLMRAAGLRSGHFYPAMDELERDGRVEARWADLEPGQKHRRRLYRKVDL